MVKLLLVRDVHEHMKETNQYVRDVLDGKTPIDKERAKRTIVMTPDVFVKIFSPQRIHLILELKKKKAENIYQLAKSLGRSYEAVHRDVTFLQGYGLIRIRTKNKKRYPSLAKIEMPVFA